MKHRFAATLAGTTLILAACGSTPTQESSDDVLPDADAPLERAEGDGVSALSAALEQTSTATSYRATTATGLAFDLGALGQSMEFEADLANPTSLIEVDADGDQYLRVDVAPMANAFLGGMDSTGSLGEDSTLEMWLDGSTVTMDLGAFGPLAGQGGDASTLDPEQIFTVDLDRLADGLDTPQIAAAVTSQPAPDPVQMASVLTEVLGDSAQIDGDTYSGTLSLSDYAAAFGSGADSMLGGMDAAFSELGGAGAADAMADLLDDITVDVSMTLADGAVDVVRFELDLTPIWKALPEIMQEGGGDIGAGGLGDMSQLLADATFEMTMLLDYDLDPTIDVVAPQGDFPDATDTFLEIYGDALGN